MKIISCGFLILINFLKCTNCISNKIVLHTLGIDWSAILKEFAAVIDLLSGPKLPYNEDADLNITQLITKYGYPVDEHRVETDDGYILTIFRIESKGPSVLLMHGLLMSADDWVTAGPDDSLAYMLASAGYDVWMGNARGNKHSRQHVSMLPDTEQFWNFSYDQIGRFDLPAMIDYVLNTTKKENIAYIGHSQGTTAFFVMCSEKPDYNNKITIMIALAPLAWSSHMKSPLARMVAPFNYYDMAFVKIFKIYEILPNPIKKFYSNTPPCEIGNGIVCTTILFCFNGFDFEQINSKNLPVIFGHMPSGASIHQFTHYLQTMMSRSFKRYDYGEDMNKEVYGCRKSPKYAVENITAAVALFYSDNDWFSDVEDVSILRNKLPNVVDYYRVPFKKFNHIDYLWAKDSKHLVYGRILELLKFKHI
ncbi:hypothetical protein PYW08_016627 [Mythimna loreyi]|uniref:Uncharacterized protein n=1 Tax=Mythimna loreyi TaxID=667449 RepID=A0ACC2QYQ4_9NEOP|nr:hypothetical protein PYW08_016627 [Mythimna loreyi]